MTSNLAVTKFLQRTAFCLTLIGCTCVFAPPTVGQEENRQRYTVNNLKDVDDDFWLMGEYQGAVRQRSACCQVGLQLVALGDGQFSAMYYAGGLPGTGWDRQTRSQMEGKREGPKAVISGNGVRIEVESGVARVVNSAGQLAGCLRKVSRRSNTLGMCPPRNATVLFNGSDTSAFKNAKTTPEGWLQEGTELIPMYRDFTLHAEYRLPYMPFARGQGRSNSGFYLQSSYEVQVLDSFGLEGVENECGALYRYKRPDQNMCLPPLQWQTYDITFRSPRFDDAGAKVKNARITVLHNGVPVHDDFELERKTGAGQPESDSLRPIKLQDHSNPVRFRNIWVIDLARR